MLKISTYKYFLYVAILISLYFQLQHIFDPILDQHGFRQTQTANTVFWFLEEGIKFTYLTPVFGWPWSTPFEFPIYQILVTWLANAFDIDNLDFAGRVVSLFFYYAIFYPLYLILKRFNIDYKTIVIIFITILVMPVFIFWSRTFMIESTALFFSLAFIASVLNYEQKDTCINASLLLVLIFSIFASLTKVTTYLVMLAFLFYYVIFSYDLKSFFTRKVFMILGVVVLTVILSVFWTSYGDSIKELNPFGRFITSDALNKWNFGTLDQRFDFDRYIQMFKHMYKNSGPLLFVLILLPFVTLVNPQHKKLIFISLLTFITSWMVLFNLYYVHNYYWYASSIFLAVLIGLIYGHVIHYFKKIWAKYIAIIFLIILGVWGYINSYYTDQIKNLDSHRTIQIANILNKYTNPNSIIYIKGLDWSSELPYYSKRKALMIPRWGGIDINKRKFDDMYRKSISKGNVDAIVLCGKDKESNSRLQYFNMINSIKIKISGCDIFIRNDENFLLNGEGISIFSLVNNIKGPHNPGIRTYLNKFILSSHIPSTASINLNKDSVRSINVGFGIKKGAYQNGNKSQGGCFNVHSVKNDSKSILLNKCINPKDNANDRGTHEFLIEIPEGSQSLIFETNVISGKSSDWGWAYWSDIFPVK